VKMLRDHLHSENANLALVSTERASQLLIEFISQTLPTSLRRSDKQGDESAQSTPPGPPLSRWPTSARPPESKPKTRKGVAFKRGMEDNYRDYSSDPEGGSDYGSIPFSQERTRFPAKARPRQLEDVHIPTMIREPFSLPASMPALTMGLHPSLSDSEGQKHYNGPGLASMWNAYDPQFEHGRGRYGRELGSYRSDRESGNDGYNSALSAIRRGRDKPRPRSLPANDYFGDAVGGGIDFGHNEAFGGGGGGGGGGGAGIAGLKLEFHNYYGANVKGS